MIILKTQGIPMQLVRILSVSLALFGLITYTQTSQAQVYWRLDSGYSWSRNANIGDRDSTGNRLFCGDPACSVPTKIDDNTTSFIIGGGVGYRVTPNLRTDFTIGYRGGYELSASDASAAFRADIRSWAYMFNGYFDIPIGGSWKPYVGAGIGYARNEIESIVAKVPGLSIAVPGGIKSGLAWSLSAGIGYSLSKTTTLDIGYRYIDLGKIETETGLATFVPATFSPQPYYGATGKLHAHELTIGLRF
jgi:opacity protein-like surface antigen